MKTICVDGYQFHVDIIKTEEYYKNNTVCECLVCKNYSDLIKEHYPNLDVFLTQFGVDITRSDENCWWEEDRDEKTVYYNSNYTVNGEIIALDNYEIDIDNLNIVVSPDSGFPNENHEPFFSLSVYNIVLPWLRSESYDEEFPIMKKRKSFFRKLFKRKK